MAAMAVCAPSWFWVLVVTWPCDVGIGEAMEGWSVPCEVVCHIDMVVMGVHVLPWGFHSLSFPSLAVQQWTMDGRWILLDGVGVKI